MLQTIWSALLFSVLVLPAALLCGEADSTLFPGSGRIELGLSGAATLIDGANSISGGVSLNYAVFDNQNFILSPGLATRYNHIRSLDVLDLEALLLTYRVTSERRYFPYVAVTAGFQQEWVGSFRTSRYSTGFNLGVSSFLTTTAALRAEYRFRRMLSDPVANFNMQQFALGLSVVL